MDSKLTFENWVSFTPIPTVTREKHTTTWLIINCIFMFETKCRCSWPVFAFYVSVVCMEWQFKYQLIFIHSKMKLNNLHPGLHTSINSNSGSILKLHNQFQYCPEP